MSPRTEDVAHALVARLEEHQQVFDEHPEGKHGVLVPQIIVVELSSVPTYCQACPRDERRQA